MIICAFTERRWDDLAAAVAAVRAQSLPPDDVVVVIDHNDDLLARAAGALDARVVPSEGAPGLSGARNTGVRAATGELLLFLDDDAVPEPEWIERTVAAFDDPQVIGVGGWAVPAWDGGRPDWFPEPFLWVVGCSYEGLPVRRAPIRNPIGAAMAFRRTAFDLAPDGFSEAVGRVGTRPVGCEETEFSIRVRQADPDVSIVLEPSARVRHRVPVDRGRLAYFVRRCWFEGRSKRVMSAVVGRQDGLESERGYVVSVLPRAVLKGLARTARTRRPGGLLSALAVVLGLAATSAGYAVAALTDRGGKGSRA